MCFFFNDTATTEIYTLSLHDALPIWHFRARVYIDEVSSIAVAVQRSDPLKRHILLVERNPDLPSIRTEDVVEECHHGRSEEHTSELQSPCNLVCRLLLDKKKSSKKCK